MKRKLCAATLILAIAAAFGANFGRFWWGDPAKVWNLLLSVCYLAAWAWFLHENSGKKALLVYKVWWSVSLTGAVLCVCLLHLHFPEFLLYAALPLSAVLLTQLFGLSYLFRPYVDWIYPIHAVICAVMLWLGIRKMKKLYP